MPFTRSGSICSFGSLNSDATRRNDNGIRVSTSATRAVSSLASSIVSEINVVSVNNTSSAGVKINRGALLDDKLKRLVQTVQQQFITTYMDFSMNTLKANIQDGYKLDVSGNIVTNVVHKGVQMTTTEKLMSELNEYANEIKSLAKNVDISDNEAEMIEQDDAYLISTYALRTIGVVNRGLLCYIENDMLNDTIVALQEDRITSSKMQSSVVFDIAATATIDLRYLAYIKKYGPPVEGVFDPVKLAEFI